MGVQPGRIAERHGRMGKYVLGVIAEVAETSCSRLFFKFSVTFAQYYHSTTLLL
jgi:hypothetical protein